MGFREATPGLVISFASTLLLALVSFNVPLIKSLNFLSATYSDGSAQFGTMGYCSTIGGTQTCVGPTIGYEFNPNSIFGVSVINIPTTLTKYLTYVLVLHIAALVASFCSMILGGLSHIRGFALLCFPSFFAYLASALCLGAFVIDIAFWYIAKARIDSVSGASASIGACVWMTLAAWLLTAVSGCVFGCGRSCLSSRRKDQERARDRDDYQNVPSTGYGSGKRMGPPVREQEVSVPLTAAQPEEQKYLEDDEGPGVPYAQGGQGANGLGRNGSVIPGVGVGYGRRGEGSDGGYSNGYAGGQGYPPYSGSSAYDLAPGVPGFRTGSPATTAGSHVGVGVPRSGAVAGAPGYVPGQGAMSAGMAGAGAGMAAAAVTGYGHSSTGHGGVDVTDQYDPYSQQPYGAQNYGNQQQAYTNNQEVYGQYPPAPVSPTRGPVSPQLRSPGGYDPYTSHSTQQQAYPLSYSHPLPAAPAEQGYGGSASPPLQSPNRRSYQDPYGGYDQGAATMPQPLPAPQPQRIVSAGHDAGFNVDPYGTTATQQQGGHYGNYEDQAHPTDDDDDNMNGPRPPSYDSAAGAGYPFAQQGQGASSSVRQQGWSANEKSRRL